MVLLRSSTRGVRPDALVARRYARALGRWRTLCHALQAPQTRIYRFSAPRAGRGPVPAQKARVVARSLGRSPHLG